MDEQKAIEMGRERMRISKDPIHGIEHAQNVEKHAFEILNSLKDDGWEIDEEVDENLILLCVWWHDCYKALLDRKFLINEFLEGFRSAKIAEEELKAFVSEKRLKMVIDAIRVHNNFAYLLFKGKSLPTLTRILIEADAVDAANIERKKKRNACSRTVFHKIAIFFVEPFLKFLQKIYIKSPYAKECLWS